MADDTSQPTATQPESGPPFTDDSGPPFTAPSMPFEGTPGAAPTPQPISPESGPALTATIPSETPPNNPDIERQFHESRLHGILNKVADILGPSEIAKVSRDPQTGDYTVQKTPATSGEKWGRIAAAALGGLSSGLANSQGPGGLARATAAGIQTGMQQPQQQQQEAQQTADAQNKNLLFKANRVKLQQDIVRQTLQNQALGIAMDDAEVDRADKLQTELDNSPWHDEVGTFKTIEEAQQAAAADPELLKNHAQAQHRIIPVYGADHKPAGFKVYNEDPSYKDQKNTEPVQVPRMVLKDDGTGLFKPTTQYHTALPGTLSNGDKDNAEDAYTKNVMQAQAQYAEAVNKREAADKKPKTLPEFNMAIADETDPQKKANLIAARDTTFREEVQLRQAGRNVTVPPSPQTIGNWGKLLSDPKSGVTLANVAPKDRDAVINGMESQGLKIAKPLTAQELNRSDLAGNAIQNIEEAQRIMERRPDMFGPVGWGKTKFQQAIAGGDPDAMAYLTAINLANLPAVGIHGVRGRWALEDLSKLDSNLYNNIDSMRNVLNEIHRSASEFSSAGGRQLETPPTTTQTPPPAGNTAQAARAPGAPPPPPPKTPNLPAPQGGGEIRFNKATNEYRQLQGNQWVQVAAPQAR